MPAACRLATASVNVSTAVSRSPAAQAARPRNPAAAPRGKWSSGPASVERPAGVRDRAVDVAAGLGDRGAVHRDHGRQGAELALPVRGRLGQRGRRRDWSMAAPCRDRPRRRRATPPPRRGRPRRAGSTPCRWRAAVGGGRRRRAARPASRAGCGPGVVGAGRPGRARRGRRCARWSPLAIACRTASASSPCSASHRLAAACSSRDPVGVPGGQTGPQARRRTGGGSGTTGARRRAATTNRFSRSRASSIDCPSARPVRASHRPPVSWSSTEVSSRNARTSSGCRVQNLLDEVVEDEPVAAGERLDEPRDVPPVGGAGMGPGRQRGQLQPGRPPLGARLERGHERGLQLQPHHLVEERAPPRRR